MPDGVPSPARAREGIDGGRLDAFFEACEFGASVISDRAVAERWSDPSALEGLTVGGVAAHLYTATRRFEVALDEPLSEHPQVVDLPTFYGLNRVSNPGGLNTAWHPMIREDAERRATQGAAAVVERFGAVARRLRNRLGDESPKRLIPVWAVADGATPLEVYMTTRVVELVVHADDLAVSVDLAPLELPRAAGSVVVDALVAMARHRSGDLEVIRTFARRERAEEDALRVL